MKTTELSENEMGVYLAQRDLDSAKATLESRQRELDRVRAINDYSGIVVTEADVEYYELRVKSCQRILDHAIADLSA
jgi:hypothetical protein